MDIEKEVFDDAEDALPEEFQHMSVDAINQRARLLENEIRVLKDESTRLGLDQNGLKEKIKENQEKIKLNNQLPYLVGNIVEVLDIKPEEEEEEDGAAVDLDSQRQGKCVVLKTSTRQTIFLPVVGLVDAASLKPGDLVGVNKDSYLVLDTLPAEYDSRVKAMEVDEKPTEDYGDIGGLDKQIQELVEAIVLPIQHKERFQKLGIRPPKGVLCYGPPGAGLGWVQHGDAVHAGSPRRPAHRQACVRAQSGKAAAGVACTVKMGDWRVGLLAQWHTS